jgi:hypothetical protein
MLKILWDDRTLPLETERHILKIETGVSLKIKNRMTVLKMTAPEDAQHIDTQIGLLTETLSTQSSDSGDHPNVPAITRFSRRTEHGRFTAYVVWGIVLSGATRKGKRFGNYRFVLVAADELPDTLSTVFNLESTLTPQPLERRMKPNAERV